MRDRAHLGPRHQQRSEVDFVVIGSGAAGGVMAREARMVGWRIRLPAALHLRIDASA